GKNRLKILEDVWNSNGDHAGDSVGEGEPQLAKPDNGASDGLGERGESGGDTEPLGGLFGTDPLSTAGDDRKGGERGVVSDSGKGGGGIVSSEASGMEGLSSGGGERGRGSAHRSDGIDGRSGIGEKRGQDAQGDGRGEAKTRQGDNGGTDEALNGEPEAPAHGQTGIETSSAETSAQSGTHSGEPSAQAGASAQSGAIESIEDKRERQKGAEGVEVKTGDLANIRESLPFLLPQQHEDVQKAEIQFFDDSHNDRDHAYGKGYMFTNGTGTGKTYTGLGIVKRFIKQGKERILILTPSQPKVSDWIKDAANLGIPVRSLDDWSKERGTTATTEGGEGAVITTFANFRQNEALLHGTFDLVVYDESHRLLENKKGEATTGAVQHYRLSNRNADYAYTRLQMTDPLWKHCQELSDQFDEAYSKLLQEAKERTGEDNTYHLKERNLIPPFFNEEWSKETERCFPELAEIRNNIISERARFDRDVNPRLEEEAKAAAGHTKVV
ncbi:MAG: DEAD/DEAH box helicase family protein, partial [Muribaculaceae bacterium]|nr:DEAD/DEAH box helicase family protein [Muribaculaceae bacterium]